MVPLGKLGKGSYGSVYLGQMENKQVAVKRGLTDLEVDFSANVRELDIVNKLQFHPNVVKLEKATLNSPFMEKLSPLRGNMYKEDYIFLVFERFTCDLHTLIHRKKANLQTKKNIFYQLLCGLEHIHLQNIVHRDIKTTNILWNGERAAFCDFGLSMINTKQEKNAPNVPVLFCRSPEIFYGLDYDGKADIWSLACVMIELLTKKPLFTNSEVEMAIVMEEWRTFTQEQILARLRSHIGKEQEDFLFVLSLMLLPNPDERFSASELLNLPFFSCYDRQEVYSSCHDRLLNYYSCDEREYAVEIAKTINLRKEEIFWYSDRIVFQALSLFSRYLEFIHPKRRNRKSYHSKEGVLIRFLCCLYISLKYFSVVSAIPSFWRFVPKFYLSEVQVYSKEQVHTTLSEYEKYLIFEVCKGDVYTNTPYEAADVFGVMLDAEETSSLLHYYGEVNGRSYSFEVFSSWMRKKKR